MAATLKSLWLMIIALTVLCFSPVPVLGQDQGDKASPVPTMSNQTPAPEQTAPTLYLSPGTEASGSPDSTAPTQVPEVKTSISPVPDHTKTPLWTDKGGAPVVISGNTLFYLYAQVGPYTPQQRAGVVSERLESLVGDLSVKTSEITVLNDRNSSRIIAKGRLLVSLDVDDAVPENEPLENLAVSYRSVIAIAVDEMRRQEKQKKNEVEQQKLLQAEQRDREQRRRDMIYGIIIAVAVTLILILILKLLNWGAGKMYSRLREWSSSRIKPLKIQQLEVISSEKIAGAIRLIVRALHLFLLLVLLYVYLSFILNAFQGTRGIALSGEAYLTNILKFLGKSLVSYVPNLFFIALTIVITFYIIRFTRFIFNEIKEGTISIPGFHEDWYDSTRKIVIFLIIAMAAAVAFPYIPGYESPAFKGISLFLGVLFSLGSTSAIANIVAGVILTYTLSFKIGDRVKIGDAMGDVVEKSLLVTRVRTIKNEVISIPNAMVISHQIINFSSSCTDGVCGPSNLILHTTVTIGYDVPWRTIHELLISAAQTTQGINSEPEPFVLQKSLDDYYVCYELNAYTDNPHIMAKTYSLLHMNIQDRFNERGVEIMSPHYRALRDGSEVTIPSQYRAKEYAPPPFRVATIKEDTEKPK